MLIDKIDCCGCSACVHICPKHSISFLEDKEGFLYPKINLETCVDCGLCEKVCPIINQESEREPLEIYAAKNDDEGIRLKSSSGGIFTLLAEKIIQEGGVVFGARFNEKWEVIHDYTETRDGLSSFRGSKYVQSVIGENYKQAENFLKAGRMVMFTGTPCQIAGLKKFLRKDYDNLLTMDFVCHGVPSPLMWREYLNFEIARIKDSSVLDGVRFRDKSLGWKRFSFVLCFSRATPMREQNCFVAEFTDNDYMKAFLSNLSLRPSCYNCSAKAGKSRSDITVGDFWGIENVCPKFDDDKGVSLLMINNSKGKDFYACIKRINVIKVRLEDCLKYNQAYKYSVPKPVNRAFFFKCIQKNKGVKDALILCERKILFYRIRRFIFRKLGV